MKSFLIVTFLICLCFNVAGQKQLVLLKNERVLLRLRPGDDFNFRLKGSKSITRTYVNNLSDTAVVTHHDTIPFHRIERVYFRQHKFYNTIGALLVIGGGGIFLIDQLNYSIIQGHKASLDSWVSTVSLTSLAVGIPLILIKKKSQKLNYKNRLMVVKKGSIFYEPDPRGYVSPFMNN